jgi:hypothetical protein
MITETLQPITCFISTKSEILRDHAAPRALAPRPSAPTALTVTTHHAERGYRRLEWSVLDWNEPSIRFYRSIGATGMDEWTVQRLTGDALTRLAAG